VLREEFEAFGGRLTLGDLLLALATPTPATWNVVPWDKPVDVALLLQAISDKISKYAVLDEHYLTAIALWIPMDWVHNEIATHSPFLDIGSTDEGQGKTLVLWLLYFLTLRPHLGAEFTSANIYRSADRDQPTMIIDEADEAFEDRQLRRIVNASWTRGEKIPRQVYDKITKEWRTYWFNVFCPKIFGRNLLPPAKPLPRTIARRCISAKIWPKREDEHVEEFEYCDDDEFATLRRKLLRFADDQAKAIAKIKPTFPVGFNNSTCDNWKLLLSIAELAGGDWPERARKAAGFVAGRLKGSRGSLLFAAFHAMCVARLKGRAAEIVIPSEEAVEFLKDFDPYWANDYAGSDGRPGEITPNKLAALLHGYEIFPEKATRGRRARGYVIFDRGKWGGQWLNMFARFSPRLPDIRTLVKRR
jgi:putative DNA primase/helicase